MTIETILSYVVVLSLPLWRIVEELARGREARSQVVLRLGRLNPRESARGRLARSVTS